VEVVEEQAEAAPAAVEAPQAAEAPQVAEAPKPAEAPAEEKAPETPVATPAGADKLTEINGIGPVIEGKLHALGITTFQQIADFTAEDVERIDGELNFKGRIEREEWISQAKTKLS